MTEMLRQSLSAAVDDEADAFELRRVLDELSRDAELREVWGRYHLIGAVLRGERRSPGDTTATGSLGDRVWHALGMPSAGHDDAADQTNAGEAAPENEGPALRRPWIGRTTALAVAASVAFAVVIGFDALQQPSTPEAAMTADVAMPPPVVPAVTGVAPESAPAPRIRLASEVSPSDLRRAHAYMLHHAQHQGLNQSGVMSLVKMATYETYEKP